MAAFVVVGPPHANGLPRTGMRLSIFPGSASPSVFPAREPFWIGYGFIPEPHKGADERSEALDRGTRFELEVDGKPVSLITDVKLDDGRLPLSKHSVANFGSGLPAGWHRFSGRWYDAGRLVLTSDRSIQFVEP
jgi:hypothetical protein